MFNKLAQEIHQQAVKSGWWETVRELYEIIALIESELTEALEEYRNGRPNVWYVCMASDNGMPCQKDGCGDWRDGECELQTLSKKPEGIAVELADTVIRILDYCGYLKCDIDTALECCGKEDVDYPLPKLVAECNYLASLAYKEEACIYFAECINLIMLWCEANGIDLMEAIEIKMAYNKTRAYRHGGKRI